MKNENNNNTHNMTFPFKFFPLINIFVLRLNIIYSILSPLLSQAKLPTCIPQQTLNEVAGIHITNSFRSVQVQVLKFQSYCTHVLLFTEKCSRTIRCNFVHTSLSLSISLIMLFPGAAVHSGTTPIIYSKLRIPFNNIHIFQSQIDPFKI